MASKPDVRMAVFSEMPMSAEARTSAVSIELPFGAPMNSYWTMFAKRVVPHAASGWSRGTKSARRSVR